jgi:hypothetical protein
MTIFQWQERQEDIEYRFTVNRFDWTARQGSETWLISAVRKGNEWERQSETLVCEGRHVCRLHMVRQTSQDLYHLIADRTRNGWETGQRDT